MEWVGSGRGVGEGRVKEGVGEGRVGTGGDGSG